MISLDTLVTKLDVEGDRIVLERHPFGRRKLSVPVAKFYELFGERIETENPEDPDNPVITYTDKTYENVDALIAADANKGYTPFILRWQSSGILE